MNNNAVAAKLFDVTVQWLDKIKDQAEHNQYKITEDEMLLIEHYRNLSPPKKEEIIRLITNIK